MSPVLGQWAALLTPGRKYGNRSVTYKRCYLTFLIKYFSYKIRGSVKLKFYLTEQFILYISFPTAFKYFFFCSIDRSKYMTRFGSFPVVQVSVSGGNDEQLADNSRNYRFHPTFSHSATAWHRCGRHWSVWPERSPPSCECSMIT